MLHGYRVGGLDIVPDREYVKEGCSDIYSCRGLPRVEKRGEAVMKRMKLKKHQLERLHEIQFLWEREKERREKNNHVGTIDKAPSISRDK